MRVLFVSGELIGASICHQLLREGVDLKLYIDQPGWKDCLDNIVPKVTDWRKELDWVGKDGLIVFDDVGYGKEQESLRTEGYNVVGGCIGGDELESDRALFQDLLEKLELPVLKSLDFDDPQAAIAHIEQNPGKWVVKQNKHLGTLNYVGQRSDGKDAISVLKNYHKYGLSRVHLQERAEGIEVGVARYFNGEHWVGPIEINHEHKRLCNDDIGPLTHEMGTIVWYSEDEELPLYKKTLAPLESYLKNIGYKGDFDINCIVNEKGIWPLEATPRFGNPSTPLHCELNISPWSDFLMALAKGEDYDVQYKKSFGIVVSIALPPFPFLPNFSDNSEYISGHNILSFNEDFKPEDLEHIHLEEFSRNPEDEEHMYYWAGTDGWTMHVTAEGETIGKAREAVYERIAKIILPKMYYRTDIGVRVEDHDLPQLKKWGLI